MPSASSSPLKILTVVGARPQFIKAAVVARAIARAPFAGGPRLTEIIVHTGQHYDANMSDVFFDEMRIPRPDHHLGIGGGAHGEMTGRMLEAIEKVALAEAPDWILVYGDTNSTLAGALVGAKLHVRVAHVEAGLRSFNKRMPEEVNRVLTDHVSDLLFVPTEVGVANLRREGIDGAAVRRVGDVMLDAALFYREIATPTDATARLIAACAGGFHVATVHRAENTDDGDRLRSIMAALAEASRRTPIVLPLHPRTRKSLSGFTPPASLHLVEPVGYFDMLRLLDACSGVLTDSGGLQKEAYFFGRRCVVLRDETEWTELVEGGSNVLAGADREKIVAHATSFLGRPVPPAAPLYGDGHAGERIVSALSERR
jgi:UDP-GlcNAc3NAcA epimerase